MTAGWQRKNVSEIATHSLGKMLDKAKNKGEPKKYLRNLNVRWFSFDLSDLLEMRFLPQEESKYTVSKGDVVVCEGGYPGRAAIWEQDESIHFQKALHRVRFDEPERAIWFLYYLYLKDLDGSLKIHFNGAGIQHFTGEALAQFQIPLPPLAEQRRIVALLNEAIAAIAIAKTNAEKSLLAARELFNRAQARVFGELKPGWEIKPLSEICVVDWGNTDLTKASYIEGGQYLAVSAAGCDGRIAHKEHDKHTPVLSAIGAQCGRMYFPEEDFTAIKNTITLTPRAGQCTGRFLFWLLDHVELPRRGAAQPFMAKGDIQSFLVRVPASLGDQVEISESLDELEENVARLESLCIRKLAALDALKQSLLHRAFSGQL